MPTLSELLKAQQELERQIEEVKQAERAEAIAKIRELMEQNGLSVKDLQVPGKKRRAKAVAKYRDPKTGATWSGRGREPAWLAGKDRRKFLIKESGG